MDRITMAGSAAACLADGKAHSATIVGGGCVVPSFEPLLDSVFDLPGPEVLSLPAQLRLR